MRTEPHPECPLCRARAGPERIVTLFDSRQGTLTRAAMLGKTDYADYLRHRIGETG